MKNKVKNLSRVFMLVLCVMMLTNSNLVMAGGAAMEFSTQVILPESQVGNATSYFDILMEPGTEEIIEIEISNLANESITVLLGIATATTDDGGTVFYRHQEGREVDNTLIYSLEDIATIQPSIQLGPKESVRVPITIKMPDEEFDGILAGGISLTQEVDREEMIEEATGMFIHQYFTEIAILLRQNTNSVEPDLLLNHIGASQRNWRNTIIAGLQNPEAMFINNMSVYASITAVGKSDILYEEYIEYMQVAPNSNFNLGIPLNGERFVSGDYVLRLEANANNGSWSFTREFTVTNEEAKAFNETDISIQRLSMWIFVAIGAAIITMAIIIYFIIYNKKSNRNRDAVLAELMDQMMSL
jgi:hypothetical protein